MPANKTALITGSCGGIGTEVSRRLDALGYRLILIDYDQEKNQLLADQLKSATAVAANLCDKQAVHALTQDIRETYGPLALAFINAGTVVTGDLAELSSEHIDTQLDLNLNSAVHLIQACAQNMLEQSEGHIIATVSMGGILSLKGSAVYAASKFGLRGLLTGLRDELKPKGIKVSGIYPSGVDTAMLRYEAENDGSALNFLNTPRTVEQVGDSFIKALNTGKLEVYVPYYDSIGARLVSVFPGILSKLYPLLEFLGNRGREKYLVKLRESRRA